MKPIRLTESAEQDLDDAFNYLHSQQPQLGVEFIEEFYKATARISRFPKSSARFSNESRKCIMDKFSYSILYREKEDAIEIGAISHHSRNPEWLKKRDHL